MKTIGITQSDSKFHLYAPWVKGEDEDIEVITLSYDTQNLEDLTKCDALVLSGGVDSHPRFYHNSRLDYPGAPKEFNEVRDEFELKVFEYARKKNLPVLAICRGMQLVNCALGGDLIQDLEEKNYNDHKRKGELEDGVHLINVEPGSFFYNIAKQSKGDVNSAHHQGLGKIADELKVTAVSDDNVPEAVEYKSNTNKPWFLAVQWHPERLATEDTKAFSENIRISFLESIKK